MAYFPLNEAPGQQDVGSALRRRDAWRRWMFFHT